MRNNKNKKTFSKTLHLVFLIFLLSTLVISVNTLKDKRIANLEYKQKLITEKNSTTTNSNIKHNLSRGNKDMSNSINVDNSKKFIALDPGHGGFDCGAVSYDNKVEEKNLTLEICKKIRDYLERENYTVFMTRSTDKAMDGATSEIEDLRKRSSIINGSNAALLVSIHINSSEEPSCTGIYNYVSNNISDFKNQNEKLSDTILKSIKDFSTWGISGTTPQNIYILNHATMPSVLVECGFITNSDDLKKLQNPNEIDTLAKGIAKGIINYTESTK